MMYLLVFIHLEDTISFSPSRYVKSLLPSPLSVPSPFDERNERHYPRKFRSLADKTSIMSPCAIGPVMHGVYVCVIHHALGTRLAGTWHYAPSSMKHFIWHFFYREKIINIYYYDQMANFKSTMPRFYNCYMQGKIVLSKYMQQLWKIWTKTDFFFFFFFFKQQKKTNHHAV